MFANVWFARAAASHWLSPSVSMPTRRCTLSVLVRVAERDVPAIGVLVEARRQVDGVDLRHELHRRLHLEVAGPLERLAVGGVQGEGADLVGVFLARLAIDPVEERGEAGLVVGV